MEAYREHLILTAPIDDSTKGRVEGVEELELSAFPNFTSIILHRHSLHVYSTGGNLLLHKPDPLFHQSPPPRHPADKQAFKAH